MWALLWWDSQCQTTASQCHNPPHISSSNADRWSVHYTGNEPRSPSFPPFLHESREFSKLTLHSVVGIAPSCHISRLGSLVSWLQLKYTVEFLNQTFLNRKHNPHHWYLHLKWDFLLSCFPAGGKLTAGSISVILKQSLSRSWCW